ncbi:general stress protein [Paenisporosarcina cavernae]|uniref:General stress protein 17M-like domain-containing protein n=1 Tax=Paenisporosarcina cavernae TaxID=2320858 RepID=A0A385YTS0_9BACL|nr:general stress protein [Paenisporosarcina cavernae]AYC28873.1 hypothetical protein D3873_02925 [Paenisporosarcina cavernae]
MKFETNRHVEIARTEDEMYERLEAMKAQGFNESDIHVISKDHGHMHTLNRFSEVSAHEAGTFMDKFKSWFSGTDATSEGLRKLNLEDTERQRFAREVENGGFVLYTDAQPTSANVNTTEQGYDTFGQSGNTYESYHGEERPMQATEPGFDDTARSEEGTTTFGTHEPEFTDTARSEATSTEPASDYSKEQGFTPSTNEFVNESEGRFDEPVDRFERGETFMESGLKANDYDTFSHHTQEEKMVAEHRPTIDEARRSDRDEFQETTDQTEFSANQSNEPYNTESQTTQFRAEQAGDSTREEFQSSAERINSAYNGSTSEYTTQSEPSLTSTRSNFEEPTETTIRSNFEASSEHELAKDQTEEFESETRDPQFLNQTGADPNLGPAPFGNETSEKLTEDMKHDFSQDPRAEETPLDDTGYEENGHGNAFAFDTNSTENEIPTGGVEDEPTSNLSYEERMRQEKLRHPDTEGPQNRLF